VRVPGDSDVIRLVSNLNWTAGQTVANYAIVAGVTPADGAESMGSVGLDNASTRGSLHVTSTSAGTSSRPGARWPGPASSVGQLPGFAGASADP
jgi:hypothetical protein